MKRKPDPALLDEESTLKKSRTTLFDNGKPRATAVGCTSFPPGVSRIVGDYSSDSERKHVVASLVGVQPITLRLSQVFDSKLGPYWNMGFLPSQQRWGSWHAEVDKHFPITDAEGCLSFLDRTNSNDCRVAVEVLVVRLSMASEYSPSAFVDLRNTLNALQGHLNNTKHVVFSLTKHSSCCFTLQNEPDNATGVSVPVDNLKVLAQIVNQLQSCWRLGKGLTPQALFAFYFTSGIQRTSEKYLAKFVISLSHPCNRALFQEEASNMRSDKIMWITSLQSYEDLDDIEPNVTHLCHFIRWDTADLGLMKYRHLDDQLARVSFYQNYPSIERIEINPGEFVPAIQLPRLGAPLTDTTCISALVELTLKGDWNLLHLTQLNNGSFQNLAHLSIIGGRVTGHLDSQKVPRLKTLGIEVGSEEDRSDPEMGALLRKHTQSLIDTGRPWQLVATKEPGGWSLASYDELSPNHQDEVKDDAVRPHSLPLIKELLLVMTDQTHADKWQAQLRGDPSLEAAAGDHSDRLLVWAPQVVQKMTAFGMNQLSIQLEFKEQIPEQTRILTSLTCYDVDVVLNGDVLPFLQSLDVNDAEVSLVGSFSQLENLSFSKTHFSTECHVNAPLLQSLRCFEIKCDTFLRLNPLDLPHLSFLEIHLMGDDPDYDDVPVDFDECLLLDVDKNGLGFSRVKHVVFGENMTSCPNFDACQMNNVSHLELSVDALKLPTCWRDTDWKCEILTINVSVSVYDHLYAKGGPIVVTLPPLPLVESLTVVTEYGCRVLLNQELPNLTECTVPSPRMLGPQLKCPALRCIRFSGYLSENDKAQCLDPATYSALGAQPRWVYFDDGDVKKMSWDVAPSATREPSLARPLEYGDGSFESHE